MSFEMYRNLNPTHLTFIYLSAKPLLISWFIAILFYVSLESYHSPFYFLFIYFLLLLLLFFFFL
jgi:hypothetical protein